MGLVLLGGFDELFGILGCFMLCFGLLFFGDFVFVLFIWDVARCVGLF